MTRLPPLPFEATDEAQHALWDSIVASRGPDVTMTDPSGSLVGPFHAMVARPHIGRPMSALGSAIRFDSALEPRLLEIAILTVGAHWRSEFEFWAHRRIGLAAGVDEAVLDALAAGDLPDFDDDPDGQSVHAFVSSLLTTGHVPQAIYDQVVAAVGVDATIDLVMTVGYYCQISFVLNAFRVEVPGDAPTTWPPPPD